VRLSLGIVTPPARGLDLAGSSQAVCAATGEAQQRRAITRSNKATPAFDQRRLSHRPHCAATARSSWRIVSWMLTEQQRRERISRLAGFFWTLDPRERSRLHANADVLLRMREAIPDRELILEAIERTWPQLRPAIATHVERFYRERPDAGNHPGAYGV
jgi:soluble lytic murein transglycosylase-like protein